MIETLRRRLGDALVSHETVCGDDVLTLRPEAAHEALRMLRDDPEFAFTMLMDLFGMDQPVPSGERFAVVYQLVSPSHLRRLRLKVRLGTEAPEAASAADLWPAADWLERETYDLFGIGFKGHPDLRRILLPDGYEGHPLRKDYPLQGHGERGAFSSQTDRTPLGDLLEQQGGGGRKEMLTDGPVREARP